MMLKDRVKWYGVISAWLFLAISTFVSVKHVFWDGRVVRFLEFSALVAALLTLIFGLISLPRWPSFFALAVVAYALYWLSHTVVAIT